MHFKKMSSLIQQIEKLKNEANFAPSEPSNFLIGQFCQLLSVKANRTGRGRIQTSDDIEKSTLAAATPAHPT